MQPSVFKFPFLGSLPIHTIVSLDWNAKDIMKKVSKLSLSKIMPSYLARQWPAKLSLKMIVEYKQFSITDEAVSVEALLSKQLTLRNKTYFICNDCGQE